MGELADLINKFGFPLVAAAGLGYFVYFVWQWATQEIKPVLSEANSTLIALIDRIRMLDNDLIRLNQKVNIVLMLRELEHDELLTKASEFRKGDKITVSPQEQKTTNDKKQESK
jgi:hypothetical protein